MIELDPNVAFPSDYRVTGSTNIATTTTSNTNKIAAAFKKDIKRDLALFSVLNEDNQCDSWKRNLIVRARAQVISEVLDSSYSLVTMEEDKLFVEKKKFMFLFLIEF